MGTLAFWNAPYTVYEVCISLNKTSFTLLWLALAFFPAQSQEPTLGGSPSDSRKTWDVTILSCPTSFPATSSSRQKFNLKSEVRKNVDYGVSLHCVHHCYLSGSKELRLKCKMTFEECSHFISIIITLFTSWSCFLCFVSFIGIRI